MKRYLIVLLLIGGCKYKEIKPSKEHIDGYKIVTIDSCEYISTDVYSGEVLVHKGNCKFCAARNRFKDKR